VFGAGTATGLAMALGALCCLTNGIVSMLVADYALTARFDSYITLRNLSLGRESLALLTRKRAANGSDNYRCIQHSASASRLRLLRTFLRLLLSIVA
jgi:hypothetical protein